MKLTARTLIARLLMVLLLAGCVQNSEPTPSPSAPSIATSPAATASAAEQPATTSIPPSPLPPTETTVATQTTAPTAQPGTLTGLEPGWWNDAVFYEIMVRSFKDSDGNGIGDFNGITESLDYLNDGDDATNSDLGITALWLMPITQSPSYHGYDVVDYYSVDDEYGTREDFQRMVDEAHRRGIRVIIDLVLNHTSTQHPWFQASDAGDPEYRDWYVWEAENPNFRGPTGQVVWHPGENGFYYGIFWDQMPDLNLENPEVTAEIYNIIEFWLTEMKVDGFRLDAIRHFVEQGSVQENTQPTHAWLQGFHTFYKSLDPSVFTVGEAWTDTPSVLDYIGDEVDIAFEFDLAGAFVRAANGPIASAATNQLEVVLESYPKGQYGVFLTNHDQDRVMSVLKGDYQKAKLAAVMLLTAPGVPFLYYGEEIGMTGGKPDEDIRRPMQWTAQYPGVGFTTGQPWRAPADDAAVANVETQSADPNSLLNLYRQLIHLRGEHPALRTGETLIVDPGTQRMYAILRYDDTEAFLILLNAHPTAQRLDQYSLSLAQGPFEGPVNLTTIYGSQNPASITINATGGFDAYQPFNEIPPHSATILHLKP